jgi:hypothetical protein
VSYGGLFSPAVTHLECQLVIKQLCAPD